MPSGAQQAPGEPPGRKSAEIRGSRGGSHLRRVLPRLVHDCTLSRDWSLRQSRGGSRASGRLGGAVLEPGGGADYPPRGGEAGG